MRSISGSGKWQYGQVILTDAGKCTVEVLDNKNEEFVLAEYDYEVLDEKDTKRIRELIRANHS